MLTEYNIPADPARPRSQDQAALYAQAIRRIRDLSNRLWTDYNLHDPGVTTLEILTYALTDLGYRADMPVEDLLASETGNRANMQAQFHTARRILPGRALTHYDYRKLLIDLPGIKNAWLSPAPLTYYADKRDPESPKLVAEHSDQPGIEAVGIKGLYRVLLDFNEEIQDGQKPGIRERAVSLLNGNRNLCEDFIGFDEVATQPFLLCGEIDLEPQADTVATHARILFEVQNYLAPKVRNYSLAELLSQAEAEGKDPDIGRIFQGPLLKCGFIPDEELEKAELRTEIRLSDVIQCAMVPGVQAVRDLIINPAGTVNPLADKWRVEVAAGRKPLLDTKLSRLVFHKRGLPIPAGKPKALEKLAEMTAQDTRKHETERKEEEEDLPIPLGRHRKPGSYFSLQNHFPAIYGLGESGLPPGSDDKRHAQALQFSAYLLFFDQLLADYLAQLSHVRDFFSDDPSIKRTFHHQFVDTFRHRLSVYAVAQKDLESSLKAEVEREDVHMQRRNRFLDHLIARHAEDFSEFADVMHSAFGSSPALMAGYKCGFLDRYPILSADRGLAYDYSLGKPGDIWNSSNISGLEKRLCSLLGISNSDRRNLSELPHDIYEEVDDSPGNEFRFRVRHRVTGAILLSSSTSYATPEAARAEMAKAILFGKLRGSYQVRPSVDGQLYFNVVDGEGNVIARRIQAFATREAVESAIDEVAAYLNASYGDEGMYVIENLLLRPERDGDPFLPICVDPGCSDCPGGDPYSYRLHIILPAYGARFADMDFRRYAERLIRSEVPAHIFPKICWIGRDDMAALERAYHGWLDVKSGRVDSRRAERIAEFIGGLYSAKNIYPAERIHDCGGDEDQRKFVLNRMALGSFQETEAPSGPPAAPGDPRSGSEPGPEVVDGD